MAPLKFTTCYKWYNRDLNLGYCSWHVLQCYAMFQEELLALGIARVYRDTYHSVILAL